MSTGKNTLIIDNTVTCGFSFFHQGEGLRICDWNNLIIQKTTPKNHLFKKRKKFSWTYTLEFWAEIFSQYSPLKVEEHNVPSEFRSDAWFMRKLLVNTLKKHTVLGQYSRLENEKKPCGLSRTQHLKRMPSSRQISKVFSFCSGFVPRSA